MRVKKIFVGYPKKLDLELKRKHEKIVLVVKALIEFKAGVHNAQWEQTQK